MIIFIRQRDINSDEAYLNKVIENAKGEAPSDRKAGLCAQYFDIRTFGAVLSTGEKEKNEEDKKKEKKGKGAGTVRGPVQLCFARSVDRIYQDDHSITRCCVATAKEVSDQEKKDREYATTFGRKSTVPYGLYEMHGFISAPDAIKSGFTQDDLDLLWGSPFECL